MLLQSWRYELSIVISVWCQLLLTTTIVFVSVLCPSPIQFLLNGFRVLRFRFGIMCQDVSLSQWLGSNRYPHRPIGGLTSSMGCNMNSPKHQEFVAAKTYWEMLVCLVNELSTDHWLQVHDRINHFVDCILPYIAYTTKPLSQNLPDALGNRKSSEGLNH